MNRYSWSKTLQIERDGARVLDAIFGPAFIIVHATKAHQQQKVDRFLIKRDEVLVYVVDYKIDHVAERTGNLALEHVSVERHGKVEAKGWLFTTPADRLVFYAPGLDTAFILLTQRLRDAWADILLTHGAKATTTALEDGYCREPYSTRFIPVPILWLRQYGLIEKELSAVGAQLRLPLRAPRADKPR